MAQLNGLSPGEGRQTLVQTTCGFTRQMNFLSNRHCLRKNAFWAEVFQRNRRQGTRQASPLNDAFCKLCIPYGAACGGCFWRLTRLLRVVATRSSILFVFFWPFHFLGFLFKVQLTHNILVPGARHSELRVRCAHHTKCGYHTTRYCSIVNHSLYWALVPMIKYRITKVCPSLSSSPLSPIPPVLPVAAISLCF